MTMTTISVHILKTNGQGAPGKLADAEIHFNGGELDGLKLTGFAVWRTRDGRGQNVSFPSRRATSEGGRSIPLVRWTRERAAQDRLEQLILAKYDMPDGAEADV